MNLNKALLTLNSYQNSRERQFSFFRIDGITWILVTLIYILALISLPLYNPDQTIWYAIYPIVMASATGLKYSSVFLRSLYVLPFILFIGIFNPLLETEQVALFGSTTVSIGWLSFLTLTFRGLFAFQALLIMIDNLGFLSVCNALRKLGFPKVLVTQLFLLYRYLGVLLEEVVLMHRSVVSRGYGKKAFPISLWSKFVGSLLIRTYDRSRRIHMAMISRGFVGEFPVSHRSEMSFTDLIFIIVWTLLFVFLHFYNLSALFS